MNVNKWMKIAAIRFPGLAASGYELLKRYWKVSARFVDYEYPDDPRLSTVSKEKVLDYNRNRPFGPKKRICYAPFNNLHFQMNGDVCSCSFNYDFNLGNVHEMSIRDIWFGEKARSFRETLANYDMDKCISCKFVLESGNYSSFPPLKYDLHGDDHARYPTQMSFELSNLCNYECVMCNEEFSSLIRKSKGLPPLKYSYPDNFAEQLEEFIPHLSIATFIGGEPLLIKPYYKMWEAIIRHNPNCTIHVQTNGSVLTDRFLELLESGQFEIGVSIDAPTKATFEKIRLRANFDEVEENIQKLVGYFKRGKIYLNFNFCPLTENWREIPQMIEYANRLGVVIKIVNVQYPSHLALQHRRSGYLKEVYDTLNACTFDVPEKTLASERNGQAFRDYVKQLWFYYTAALDWESFQRENEQLPLGELVDILHGQMYTIKNFLIFSDAEKEYIFSRMCEYILGKTEEDAIRRHIFLRVIHNFSKTEHVGESITGENMEVGLSIFFRMVDGHYQLELDLLSEAAAG